MKIRDNKREREGKRRESNEEERGERFTLLKSKRRSKPRKVSLATQSWVMMALYTKDMTVKV